MITKITMEGKYQTRDGKPARVICLDADVSVYPVIALVKDIYGLEVIKAYTEEGLLYAGRENTDDLVPLKEKKTVYVNFYPNGTATWHGNKPDAVCSHSKSAITKAVPVEIEVKQ